MKAYRGLNPTPGLSIRAGSYTVTVGDVDADGADEVVVHDPQGLSLNLLAEFNYQYLCAAWSGQPSRLLSPWVAVNELAGGWVLHPPDVLLAGDFDGDGCEEFLIWDRQDGFLGILKWGASSLGGASSLACAWGDSIGSVVVQPELGPAQYLQFVVADVDGDGQDEVFVYDPTNKCVAVLQWNGTALAVLWGVTGTIPGGLDIQSYDVFFSAHLDLGVAARADAIVAYVCQGQTMVALGWDSTAKQLKIYGQPSFGTLGTNGWSIAADGSDQYFACDTNNDGWDELYAYNQTRHAIGLITWSASQFATASGLSDPVTTPGQTAFVAELDGARQASLVKVVAAPGTGNVCFSAINVSSDGSVQLARTTQSLNYGAAGIGGDCVAVPADLDGDGKSELVAISAALGTLGTWGWAHALTNVESFTASVPGYSPTLIAAAPANGFVSFTGVAAEIYAKVGPSLTPAVTDLRAAYTNENDVDTFSGWDTQLADADPQLAQWSWLTTYKDSDWRAVTSVLATECGAVSVVYGYYQNGYNALGVFEAQQETDVGTCIQNIEESYAPSSSTGVEYWMNGVLDACLWGMAAVPGLDLLAVPLAMFASIAGTAFGTAFSGDPQSTTFSADAFKTSLRGNLVPASAALTGEAKGIVSDQYKLELLGSLLQGAWRVDLGSIEQNVKAGSGGNRIAFYQALVPKAFYMGVNERIHQNEPELGGEIQKWVPACSYYGVDVGGGRWDVYWPINYSSGWLGNNYYCASIDLMTDLDGLSQRELMFTGNWQWSFQMLDADDSPPP